MQNKSNLIISDDVRSEFRVELDGKCFSSVNGTSKLVGVNESTLREHFSSSSKNPSKLSQTLIEQGFEPSGFSQNGVPDIALTFIAEYYALDAGKRCTEEAKKFLRLSSSVGMRVLMQQALEWTPEPVKHTIDVSKITKAYLAELILESEEQRIIAEYKLANAERKIEEDAHLVNLAQTLLCSEHTVTITELAKLYGIGRNKFFQTLRDIKFLTKVPRNLPYQGHINSGYAEVYRKDREHQSGVYDSVTVLTIKGQEWIAKRLAKQERLDKIEVQMEAVTF